MLLTNMLPGGGNGDFTLYVFAEDSAGQQTLLGEKDITCDNDNRTKPFGTIDTPTQGERIDGSNYINFGWALTPAPKEIPRDGSTIWVWLDGQPLGHPDYNHYRSDIATLFPECLNSDGAVGFYILDTTSFANGLHSLAWSVEDNWGESDGIGSRWIEIFNGGSGGGTAGVRGTDQFWLILPPLVNKNNLLRLNRDDERLTIRLIGWFKGLTPAKQEELMKFLPVERTNSPERADLRLFSEKKPPFISLLESWQESFSVVAKGRDGENQGEPGEKLAKKKTAWLDADGVAWLKIEAGERIELHFQVIEGAQIIGWGRNTNEPLPPGSHLNTEKKIFYWWPGPGVKGRFLLHFAVTDGLSITQPLTVVINVE